ncbi:MAG: hypothetical protein H7833_19495 [Magnetococcus sp. DMHC-1]
MPATDKIKFFVFQFVTIYFPDVPATVRQQGAIIAGMFYRNSLSAMLA